MKRDTLLRYQNLQDGILAGLLRESPAAKATLAEKLQEGNPAIPFREIYTIGDDASNGIVTVVLSPAAWKTEAAREACEKNVFQLYVHRLLAAGDGDNSRAMKGISRLMAADASKLYEIVDDDVFDAILSCLDYRNPMEIKSPATLTIVKYIEAAEDRGQINLTKFVTAHYAKQTAGDLILAFSAAAAVFPIATPTAVTLFLTKDFLSSLVPLMEKRAKSKHVEMAALEMLNAACIDGACRQSIKKYCMDWLTEMSKSNQANKSAIATVVLAKVQNAPSQDDSASKRPQLWNENEDIVHKLTQLMFEDPKANRNTSFEGLAHSSIHPKIKEKLVNDKTWLEVFLQELGRAEAQSPAIFGGLMIIDNLTAFLPVLSEEQKRMAQLKTYANAAKPSLQRDPLDEDEAVMRRCQIMIEKGAAAIIIGLCKDLSPTCLTLVFKIMLSLTRSNKGLKAIITRQGGVKMLVTFWDRVEGTPTQQTESRRNAAQALARLLISSDPSIVFGRTGNALLQSTIPPLMSLLTENATMALEGPRDLLPTYEALLALTNLASIPGNGAASNIVKSSYTSIEDLALAKNTRIQCAAIELVCNLAQDPAGTLLFADPTPEAERRLYIILALTGSEDLGTRKAAGGALASLTEWESIIRAINKREGGIEMVLTMLDDEYGDVIHRGMVCLVNVINVTDDEVGRTARKRLRQLDVERKLREVKGGTLIKEIHDLVDQALGTLEGKKEP